MFGELIIPILLSMASPEAVEHVPADAEEITQYICEDDLLAGGEKTLKPSDVKPTEKAPMHEGMMQDKSMPMHEEGMMQDKSMPMHKSNMQKGDMREMSMPMQENQQPAEPKQEGRRCSRCSKLHLRQ
ncbi:MAG: hypothetical protein K1000chlam4_00602 [Chlamydiae bacterium]|nr:hypothetical protein [Chlamydiota bacterium]